METVTEKLANEYQIVNGTAYHADTPAEVVTWLETARQNHDRVRVFLGDSATGRDWGEENDVTGYVGRSTGKIRIPILVNNRRSMGGGALLDNRIVRLIVNGREVYRHWHYNQPVYTVVTDERGENVYANDERGSNRIARFDKTGVGYRWVDFMTGKRLSK